jgi:hypothetical protein
MHPGLITCTQLIKLVHRYWQVGAIADVNIISKQLLSFGNGARRHKNRDQTPRPPPDGALAKDLPGHVAGLVIGIVHCAPRDVVI